MFSRDSQKTTAEECVTLTKHNFAKLELVSEHSKGGLW